MTELERYLFDLQGFIVVENALNSEQVAGLQEILNKLGKTWKFLLVASKL